MRDFVNCRLCDRELDTEGPDAVAVDVVVPEADERFTERRHICRDCAERVATIVEETP